MSLLDRWRNLTPQRRSEHANTLAVLILVVMVSAVIVAITIDHRRALDDQAFARGYWDAGRTGLTAAECEVYALRLLPRREHPDIDLDRWRDGCLTYARDRAATIAPNSWQ